MKHIEGHAGQQTVAALQEYGIDTMFTDVYALPQKNLSPTAKYHHGARNPLL